MEDATTTVTRKVTRLLQATAFTDVLLSDLTPPETALDALVVAERDARTCVRRLLAEAANKTQRRQLLQSGVALRVAIHHAEAELVRFGDDSRATAVATQIAKRLIASYGKKKPAEEIPADFTMEAKRSPKSVTTAEAAHIAAASFVPNQFALTMTEFAELDPNSGAIADMVGHRALLAGYDLLIAHYGRAEATKRAAIIAREAIRTFKATANGSLIEGRESIN